MELIKTFSLSRIRNDEAFGFHSTVIDGFKYLPRDPEEGVSPAKTEKEEYSAAFEEYDLAYKNADSLKEVAETENASKAVSEAWGSSYNYLKAMMRAPDETMRNAASTLMEEYQKYGNPTNLSQLEKLSVVQNLINDLNIYDLDTINGCAFNMWLEYLSETTDELQDKITRRSEASGRRVKGKIKKAKDKVNDAYNAFANRINVIISYEKSNEYDTFIHFLNALIDRQQTIIKTRVTKSKNEKEEEEKKLNKASETVDTDMPDNVKDNPVKE